jgi:hypothetical protein
VTVSIASDELTGSAVRTAWIGRKTRIAAVATGVVVAAVATATFFGAARWARATQDVTARITGAVPSHPVSFSDIASLPEPVQRYLRLALRDGQPRIATARLRQSGRLRTGVESQQWLDFEASETIAPEARAFVWDARLRLAPLVHTALRDTYVDGIGHGTVALQSAFTVADEQGGHELNAGDLYRLLAEAPWAPTLLLPRDGLMWSRIDGSRALASLTVGGETATMEFRFNAVGEISSVYAAERPRRYGTTYVGTPWEGRFSRYLSVNGMRVPEAGEVGWWVEDRWIPVWQGTVHEFGFESAAR